MLVVGSAGCRKIEIDDAQLIRYWRNLPYIRTEMVYTQTITRDEQRRWFDLKTNMGCQYYIYSLGSIDIGCFSIADINNTVKTFEGGIFCGDSQYLNHWINIWAIIRMYDIAFTELGMESSFATILPNNKTALALNKRLGYKYFGEQESEAGRFILLKDIYFEKSASLRRFLRNFAKQSV